MGRVRILSIDGGGVRGIIPSEVLVTLEELLKKNSGRENARLVDYFDIIAGTSIGGILTAMYLCPDKNNYGRPMFSAQEVALILKSGAPLIFSNPLIYKLSSGFGLIGPKYSEKNIRDNFKEYLGDVKLSELLRPCLITAYDIEKRNAVFFNQMSARRNKEKDFFVSDVVRATSAAPIYFPAANIKSLTDTKYALIDGGVFANNPALCSYVEASKFKGGADINNMMVLSIGTGIDDFSYSFKKAKNWGAIKWAIPIIQIFMGGISETVDYQMKIMFDAVNKSSNYLRIQANLDKKIINSFKIDDCSKKNIDALTKIGKNLVNEYFNKLDSFARELILS